MDKIQEKQDKIFAKIPVSRKIRLASGLTMLCLELNHLKENEHSSQQAPQKLRFLRGKLRGIRKV